MSGHIVPCNSCISRAENAARIASRMDVCAECPSSPPHCLVAVPSTSSFFVFLLPFSIVAQLPNGVLKNYTNKLGLCIHVICPVSPKN